MFGVLHGREAIAGSYAKLFRTFPDWTFTYQPLVIDDERVVQLFAASATHSAEFMALPATGRHFNITGARMHVIKDTLVREEHWMYDFTGL
jgi:predicted ester cyclase